MALDHTADHPLSLRLADVLRLEIREGIRAPGSQLPTESEFHETYGVSRTTVRAALQQLVSDKPIFDTEVDAQGQVPSRRMLKVGPVEAPSDIAQWLQTKPGGRVVARSRLQLINDQHEFVFEWAEPDPGEPSP
jgi:DNA-binding GntR family transcriptional regulator